MGVKIAICHGGWFFIFYICITCIFNFLIVWYFLHFTHAHLPLREPTSTCHLPKLQYYLPTCHAGNGNLLAHLSEPKVTFPIAWQRTYLYTFPNQNHCPTCPKESLHVLAQIEVTCQLAMQRNLASVGNLVACLSSAFHTRPRATLNRE